MFYAFLFIWIFDYILMLHCFFTPFKMSIYIVLQEVYINITRNVSRSSVHVKKGCMAQMLSYW